jgi:hypothetical protein
MMNPDFAYAAAQNPSFGMLSGQQTGFSSPDAAPSTSINRASVAMARAAELCARLETLADRLCGSVPTAVNTTGNQIKGNGPGVLPQLDGHATELEEFVQRGYAALARIDNSI